MDDQLHHLRVIKGPSRAPGEFVCLRRSILTVVILLVAAGCNPAATGEDAVTMRGTPSSSQREPLGDLYELVNQNDQVLYEAEQKAVAACMNLKGFDYRAEPWTEPPVTDSVGRAGDLETAKQRGYGVVESLNKGEVPLPASANKAAIDGMDPEEKKAWDTALLGDRGDPLHPNPNEVAYAVPGGGNLSYDPKSCVAVGRAAVYGEEVRYSRVSFGIMQLANDIGSKVQSDGVYLEALDKWRDCMLKRGYNYPRPGAAIEFINARTVLPGVDMTELRSVEIATATADAECYREVSLDDIEKEVRQKYELESERENEALVLEFHELQQNAVDRAKAAIDG